MGVWNDADFVGRDPDSDGRHQCAASCAFGLSNAADYFVVRSRRAAARRSKNVLVEIAVTLGRRDEADRAVTMLMVVPAHQFGDPVARGE